MDSQLQPDEKLLRRLLEAEDRPGTSSPLDHPGEESLVSFAAGALAEPDRIEVVKHLDACPTCRRTASLLLTLSAQEAVAPVVERPAHFWAAPSRTVWFALAASLLVAVGLLLMAGRDSEQRIYGRSVALLTGGHFAEAREELRSAAERGIQSDRLSSVEAEALREIPDPVALAHAGRLSDFGYDIDGTVARDPANPPLGKNLKPAADVLSRAGSAETEAVLNRGHVLLSLGQGEKALDQFKVATQLDPKQALAWLGMGLAYYMLDDFAAAEDAFGQCLKLDENNLPAQINLAMTLDERDKPLEALATWRRVLKQNLPDSERKKIEQVVEQLQQRLPQ